MKNRQRFRPSRHPLLLTMRLGWSCNNLFSGPFALVNSANPKNAVFVLSMAPVLVCSCPGLLTPAFVAWSMCPGLLTPAFVACSTRQSQTLVFLRNLEIGTQIARNILYSIINTIIICIETQSIVSVQSGLATLEVWPGRYMAWQVCSSLFHSQDCMCTALRGNHCVLQNQTDDRERGSSSEK